MSPIKVINLWNESSNKNEFKAKLLKHGFKIIGFGAQALVFSKKSLDFVIKVTQNGGLPNRKFRETDLEQYRLGYLFLSDTRHVGIQKKVNRNKKSKYRAWAKIRDAVEVHLEKYDIHQDNVGFLNRRPVIFDYK